jgi:hypothetical protein
MSENQMDQSSLFSEPSGFLACGDGSEGQADRLFGRCLDDGDENSMPLLAGDFEEEEEEIDARRKSRLFSSLPTNQIQSHTESHGLDRTCKSNLAMTSGHRKHIVASLAPLAE